MTEIVSAVPTPFDEDGGFDAASARRMFARLAEAGVDAVFVAGTTGEFPALEDDERIDLVRLALEAFGPGRVIAHIGAPDARHTAALARRAVDAGARRLAAITPYYLSASEAAVRDHYRRIVDAAEGVPVSAYLFPARTTTRLDPQAAARVLREAGLSGAKLTFPDTTFLADLAPLVPDAELYAGADALVAETTDAGGRGVISAVSAALPDPFTALAHAVDAGSGSAAEQRRVDETVAALGDRVALGKAALVRLGVLTSGACRQPYDPPTPAEAAAIDALLSRLQPVAA